MHGALIDAIQIQEKSRRHQGPTWAFDRPVPSVGTYMMGLPHNFYISTYEVLFGNEKSAVCLLF